jgi:RHS repeat-associated protein
MNGRLVLKRCFNYKNSAIEVLSTYYVYDDFGKLAFVLPPMVGADGAGAISQATLDNLCYQYQYDQRGRMIQKKIPGKGWEYIVYNILDQPVATQDIIQQGNKQWIFTKYDALGRPVQTGIWNNGGTSVTRASLQTTLTGIATNLHEAPVNSGNGYTNVSWPTANVTATLSLDYYDTYANIPGLPATYTLSSGVSKMLRTLPTVKKTAILNTPTDQLWDVIYYDDLGRTTHTYSQHYLGGTANTNNYDHSTITYNFANAPTTSARQHWNTASTAVPLLTITNTYTYDQVGRKRSSWEQITNGSDALNGAKVLVSRTDYDEAGQTLTKHLHGTDTVNFYQNVAYTYNERGWLLSSSAPLFAINFYYTTLANKAYNGNLMYQYWGTPGNTNTRFAYNYDSLDRLLAGSSTANNNEYPAYDQNGNISALNRWKAGSSSDVLSYNYTVGGLPTNQLQYVNNSNTTNTTMVSGITNYLYDGNGNMLSATNSSGYPAQNKSITYNLLNLPLVVTVPTGTVTYTYDATGNKLRKVAVTNSVSTVTDYISGIQYKTNSTALDFIQTEEGKAVPTTSNGYDYYYYLGDNLGNTRVTFDTQTGFLQTDDYYPFGLEIPGTVASPKNEYLYNRKELQEELKEYDYGARFYDPVIGRWNTIDPLAEISRRFSPYNYVENNPIRLIDVDGMFSGDPSASNNQYDAAADYIDNYIAEQNEKDEAKKEAVKQGASWALAAAPGGGGHKGPGDKKKKGGNAGGSNGGNNKKPAHDSPDWVYKIPVWGEAAQAGDSWEDGNYGEAAVHEVTGFAELALFAEDQVVSAWNKVGDFFIKRFTTSASETVFDVTKSYMGSSEMSTYIRELEAGFKGGGSKLPADHKLTTNQLNALSENLKLTITKTIPNASTKQAIINQLANPRWRFIDQIPGGRAAINQAIKGLGIIFKY